MAARQVQGRWPLLLYDIGGLVVFGIAIGMRVLAGHSTELALYGFAILTLVSLAEDLWGAAKVRDSEAANRALSQSMGTFDAP